MEEELAKTGFRKPITKMNKNKRRKMTGSTFGVVTVKKYESEVQLAKLLYQTLVKRQIRILWSIDRQAKLLSQFRKSLNPPSLLDQVMQWYCAKFDSLEKYKLPKVTSCSQFIKLWSWIFERYQAAEVKNFTFNRECNPSLQFAFDSISRLDWPATVQKTIALHVQRTWDSYCSFYKSVVTLRETTTHTRYANWLEWTESCVLQPPSVFVINWWVRAWNRVKHRDSLAPGDLAYYEFKPDKYQYELMAGAAEYGIESPEQAVAWLYAQLNSSKGKKDAKS